MVEAAGEDAKDERVATASTAQDASPDGPKLVRLGRNLAHDPRRFVRSVVRRRIAPIARRVLWFVPERGTVPSVHDQRTMPSTSLVAVLGQQGVDDLLARSFGHNTEVVLLVDGRDRQRLVGWLSELRARACRVYVFERGRPREEMLRYGLSRAYGRRIAVRTSTGVATSTSLSEGVAALREVADAASRTSFADGVTTLPDGIFVDTGPLLLLDHRAAREVVTASALRADLRAAFARACDPGHDTADPDAAAANERVGVFAATRAARTQLVERLAERATELDRVVVYGPDVERLAELVHEACAGQPAACTVVDTRELSDYFVYRAPPPGAVFAQPAECGGIVCLERRPAWMRAMPERDRGGAERVTVIMTVYNGAGTVDGAIDSILEQSHRDIEVLVVDDGSTDDSVEVVTRKAHRDPRIRVLQTPSNSGTYMARNLGLLHATGEFVTFQDADDISLGHRIELQVAALHADPHAFANLLRYQRVSDDTGRVLWLGVHKDRPAFVSLLLRRQQTLETVGFFDSVRVGADSEFVARLTAATGRNPQVLPFVGYIARHADGSLTTSGAGQIALAADGSVTMPPARVAYWEAAQRWHARIASGDASAYLEFPLGERPFPAPDEIVAGSWAVAVPCLPPIAKPVGDEHVGRRVQHDRQRRGQGDELEQQPRVGNA